MEGDIRHFAVGRKNWLFSDTPADADSSAIIYSLMQTAMANGKEPYAWMRYVMEQLPACQAAELPSKSNSCCHGTANHPFTAEYDNALHRLKTDGVYGALTYYPAVSAD